METEKEPTLLKILNTLPCTGRFREAQPRLATAGEKVTRFNWETVSRNF